MTVGQTAPIDPLDRYAQMMNNVDRRIGDLERRTSRRASGNVTVVGAFSSNGPVAGYNFQDRDGTTDIGTLYRSGNLNRIWSQSYGDQLLLDDGGYVTVVGPQLNISSTYGGGFYMGDSTWIRTVNNKNLYAGSGIIACEGGMAIGSGGGVTANNKLTVNGNINLLPTNPYISAPSYIQMPGGLYVSGGILYSAAPIYARGGVGNDQGTMIVLSRTQIDGGDHNAGTWSNQNVIFHSATYNETGFSMWNSAGGLAPQQRVYQTFGERFDFVNNPSSAYVTICAASFSVQSSLRTKQDITPARDVALLASICRVRTQRYLPVVRPQTLRKTERFVDLDRRWQARGHRALIAKPKHHQSHDHDCAIDPCPPTCPIALNDHERFGLIAEDLHDAIPEVVWLDEQGEPGGYDVDQVAALAFGGVGALTRLIVQLHERLTELENAA